jgi:NADPH-dependent glutamate synthase beta subunit-like oxidoreductase
MGDATPIKVAIIGSGPAGFYTAEALMNACDRCQIDIIERLPTPYGLIRGGVAPDHQTTKKVAKKFEKTALKDRVRYYGNVEINRHVGLGELRQIYDAVVLAIGAPGDRVFSIPGADKYGVFGSAAFVGWYNGHPDFRELDPQLDVAAACVVGNGNVAVDCARILSRSPAGLARTDLPVHVRDAIAASPLRDIYLLGRRGPADASFTNVELRELGELSVTQVVIDPADLPTDVDAALAGYEARARRVRERNLVTLSEHAKASPADKPKRLHLKFYLSPIEVLGGDRVEGLRCEKTRVVDGRAVGTGETVDIPCGLIIAAIGYRADPIEGAPYDADKGIIPNVDGRVSNGLYAVGWIKRGPTGVISSNRPDGEIVAQQIREDTGGQGDPGREGRERLEALLRERGQRWVSFDDWRRLEALEVAAAETGAPRRKFLTIGEMLEALDGERPAQIRENSDD